MHIPSQQKIDILVLIEYVDALQGNATISAHVEPFIWALLRDMVWVLADTRKVDLRLRIINPLQF